MAYKYVGKKALNITKRVENRPKWFTFKNGDLIPDDLVELALKKTNELEKDSEKLNELEKDSEKPKKTKKTKKSK